MEFDLSILFFLKRGKIDKARKAPIYCRITVNGERAEISTNEKTEIPKWDCHSQRIKGRSEETRTINKLLDTIEIKIRNLYNKMIENEEEISAGMLRDIYSGKKQKEYTLVKVFEEVINLMGQEIGKKYAERTVNHYGTNLERLKTFLNQKYGTDDIKLNKLDIKFIRRYDIFLRTEYKTADNTTMKYLKQLKKVIHFAMNWGTLIKIRFFITKLLTKK